MNNSKAVSAREAKAFEQNLVVFTGCHENSPSTSTTLSKTNIRPHAVQIKRKLLFHLPAPTFMLPATMSQEIYLHFISVAVK